MQDLLSLHSCHLSTPSPIQCTCSCTPLSINLGWLHTYLNQYPAPMFAKYVADGLQGHRIGFNYSSPLHSAHKNHPSSGENPAAVVSHMHQQLGRMSGPISANLIHNIHVSPIGLVPKPHSNKLHLIVDLSFLADSSISDGIFSSIFLFTAICLSE